MRRATSFTLKELLMAVAVVAMLAAIAAPLLNAARESAQLSTCSDNLRRFFASMELYADNDPMARFCSGAFDGKRDGCIDSVGWVADMVNRGLGEPGKLLCPSNPARLSESVNDYLTGIVGEATPDTISRIGAGFCATHVVSPGVLSPMPGVQIQNGFLTKGYNTNYTSSWFLVRSMPLLTTSDGVVLSCPTGLNIKSLRDTQGPLTRRMVDNCYHASAIILLMFDGNPKGPRRAVLAQRL